MQCGIHSAIYITAVYAYMQEPSTKTNQYAKLQRTPIELTQ